LVASFCSDQVPSRSVKASSARRHLGTMRTSKPAMLKSRFGLSRLKTETKLASQSSVVMERGRRLRTSQKTARPRFTSCFMRRMRASRGQHRLLL